MGKTTEKLFQEIVPIQIDKALSTLVPSNQKNLRPILEQVISKMKELTQKHPIRNKPPQDFSSTENYIACYFLDKLGSAYNNYLSSIQAKIGPDLASMIRDDILKGTEGELGMHLIEECAHSMVDDVMQYSHT